MHVIKIRHLEKEKDQPIPVEGESKPTSSLSNMLRASERATYLKILSKNLTERRKMNIL
jgi:hypothetical protein